MKEITKRILTATIGIPAGILLIYLGGLYFLAFILLISSVGLWEFYKISGAKGIQLNFYYGVISNILAILISYINIEYSKYYFLLPMELFLLFFFSLFVSMLRKENISSELAGSILLGFFYITLGFVSVLYIREYLHNGLFVFLTIIFSIWICDSAAYFTGISIGKHKLWERISPKKTWEGATGGFVGAILSVFIFDYIFKINDSIIDTIILGLIIGIFGQLGDLFESKLKRDAKIKDSSDIIPGHGGVMDRFDSLLFVSPLILLYLMMK